MRKRKAFHNFYKSVAWRNARNIKINRTQGKCECCKAVGEEVHHKIRLTVYNVDDYNVSLNQDNLEPVAL